MIFKRFILILCLYQTVSAMASRTDTFSIAQSVISLEIKNFSARTIRGSVLHAIHFKEEADRIRLDLIQMTVDSVVIKQEQVSFERKGASLIIHLGRNYMQGDSLEVLIYYQGIPGADPGGWGGFYFSGDFAFNLGVGFKAEPHSFGRAWFPCVDEFPMKSAYEFFIETDTAYTAACNGILMDTVRLINGIIWHYKEPVPMSSYLVSVSVGRYAILEDSFSGISGQFPTRLYCRLQDTGKVRYSFSNLHNAIGYFENAFGPQLFSKVGYNFVPFSSGAMEHAGNITYPSLFADGTLNYEGLMAHELSHHWWGNNVTCATEGDMWLNEGWASYCEHFFMEAMYGKESYCNSVRSNHAHVLRFAHIRDGNIFGLTGIPSEHTYGTHVYRKGADVIHSLRGVTGDSVFFKACRLYNQKYRLGTAGTEELKNTFREAGGGETADSFFSQWVVEKGFPHIILYKQIHSGNGPFQVTVQLLQKPRFTERFCSRLPVELFFFRDINHFEKKTVVVNSELDSFTFTFDFKPVFICIDREEKLSEAISDREIMVTVADAYDFKEALCKLTTHILHDTALIRVEHHWTGPEKYRTGIPLISDYRYYTLDGIWDENNRFELELPYDGRQPGASASVGYLDHTLINKTEDSLTVMYRAFPGDYWRVWPELTFIRGNMYDKQGRVLIHNARKGDYVFAIYDYAQGLKTGTVQPGLIRSLYPNPAADELHLECIAGEQGIIQILDINGKIVHSVMKPGDQDVLKIDISHLSSGMYTLIFANERDLQDSGKFQVLR